MLCAIALAVALPGTAHGQTPACSATPHSLTPPGWAVPIPVVPGSASRTPLRVLQDYVLPGPANRFDYQSLDPASGRLYLNHMNAGRLVVFDVDASKLIAEVPGLSRATGVRLAPTLNKIFVSAAGTGELAVIDDRTLTVTARVGGIRFPDGIGFVPGIDRVFVSDEAGGVEVVIDARTNVKRGTIPLGGEAGNTQYDSVSHCILVAVQTKNQLVAIDPATEKIVGRYDLPGSDGPHGFALDEPGRLAFVSGEGNSKLQVVDLRTMRVIATHSVGSGPDVLAWDAGWRRLYVASEGGVLSAFEVVGAELHLLEEYRAPAAHTVSVDPRTHRVYLPLQNVGGQPVLRVLSP